VSVNITSLDFSGLDDLGVPAWLHDVEVAATAGISLAWDKKERERIGKGMAKAYRATEPALKKVVQKIVKPAVCAAGKALKDDKSGYGVALRIGAGVLCPEKKKEEPKRWYDSPLMIGAAAAGAGVLLGVLLSR
jgi:hypothetical protein